MLLAIARGVKVDKKSNGKDGARARYVQHLAPMIEAMALWCVVLLALCFVVCSWLDVSVVLFVVVWIVERV